MIARNEEKGGVEYNPDVRFAARPVDGGEDWKSCEGCHNISSATELLIPSTMYHDGRRLSTKYLSFWLCPECMAKLRKAVNGDN